MIWASVKRLFFIGISSSITPRKFYLRTPLTIGRITCSFAPLSTTDVEGLQLATARTAPTNQERLDRELRLFGSLWVIFFLSVAEQLNFRESNGMHAADQKMNDLT